MKHNSKAKTWNAPARHNLVMLNGFCGYQFYNISCSTLKSFTSKWLKLEAKLSILKNIVSIQINQATKIKDLWDHAAEDKTTLINVAVQHNLFF